MTLTKLAECASRRVGLVSVLSALLFGCSAGVQQPPAQSPPQASSTSPSLVQPAVSINSVMVAWIDHSGHELWDSERPGKAPKNDADWRRLERHATQLAAAGSLISLGGTGEYDMEWSQRPGWKTHAQALTDAAVAALNAVRARNFEQVVRANGALTESCERCHDEFKPTLPTEGIVHQPY